MNINVTVGDDETIYCNVQLITPVVNIGMIGIKGDTGGIPSSGIPVSNGTDWVDSITATAESDFILSGPSPFSWVKKTLAQVKTILGHGDWSFATAAEITTGTESAKAIAPDQLALSSPTVVTVKCSGLTDLKVPKHTSDAVGLADTTITVSANNEVTNASQPAFLATAGEQSNVTGDGTIYTVTFGSEVYDHNEDFDGTSTFTAPVTGIYHFNVSLQISGLAAANSGYVTLNCSNRKHAFSLFSYGAVLVGSAIIVGGSTDIDMDAGDTAIIQLYVAGATKVVDISSTADSRFSGHLIC